MSQIEQPSPASEISLPSIANGNNVRFRVEPVTVLEMEILPRLLCYED